MTNPVTISYLYIRNSFSLHQNAKLHFKYAKHWNSIRFKSVDRQVRALYSSRISNIREYIALAQNHQYMTMKRIVRNNMRFFIHVFIHLKTCIWNVQNLHIIFMFSKCSACRVFRTSMWDYSRSFDHSLFEYIVNKIRALMCEFISDMMG